MTARVHRGCALEGATGIPYLLQVEGTEQEQTLEIPGGNLEAALRLRATGPAFENSCPRYRVVFHPSGVRFVRV